MLGWGPLSFFGKGDCTGTTVSFSLLSLLSLLFFVVPECEPSQFWVLSVQISFFDMPGVLVQRRKKLGEKTFVFKHIWVQRSIGFIFDTFYIWISDWIQAQIIGPFITASVNIGTKKSRKSRQITSSRNLTDFFWDNLISTKEFSIKSHHHALWQIFFHQFGSTHLDFSVKSQHHAI